mmetsp:Transcript_11568/g.24592  ORF Transcript_11568/g.24592 Transcript_11568/m.24592 type:complete len:204 (-) Transcript_11568:597-1208(-)
MWQRRWFVLLDTVLVYYRRPRLREGKEPLDLHNHDGRYDLRDFVSVAEGLMEGGLYPFQVTLTDDICLDLGAPSSEVRKCWVSALKAAVARANVCVRNLALAEAVLDSDVENVTGAILAGRDDPEQAAALEQFHDSGGHNAKKVLSRMKKDLGAQPDGESELEADVAEPLGIGSPVATLDFQDLAECFETLRRQGHHGDMTRE